MNKRNLTFINAPEALFRFERENFSALSSLTVDGWNIWQLCKTAIFYNKIRTNASSKVSAEPRKSMPNIFFKLVNGLVITLFSTIVLIVRTKKSNTVYFALHEVDKLSKNLNGEYYNSLMHPILDEQIISDYLILETPGENGFSSPSAYPYVNAYGFELLGTIMSRIYNINKHEKVSRKFCHLLNAYLEKEGFIDRVEISFIRQIIARFLAERKVYKVLFSITSPRLIISSEKMTTGFMAAAIESSLPILEFQHGAMDEYYPHYVWDTRFMQGQKIMKPTKLVVFGRLAKDIVVKYNYFSEDEVIEVGYQKLDQLRSLIDTTEEGLFGLVLIVMQPLMHTFNIDLLETLAALQLKDVKFLVKPHPLQTAVEIDEYNLITSKYDHIQILENRQNIHQLIRQSDLVIGYLSTTLEEAISLGKPAFTIATKDTPKGIHNLTGSDRLINTIRPVSLSGLAAALHKFYMNNDYQNEWIEQIKSNKYAIYQKDYAQNIRILLDTYIPLSIK